MTNKTENNKNNWCVVRCDDNDNEFVIEKDLSLNKAKKIANEFEAKGHKQIYWVRKQ